ncbi:uncharacterized protein LOC126795517 [Argentina anserina]|uniref:uncharacterized protein LOC126795517 n=1 Tax=Argentina anserina TaxID=57926 RepID=UPI0021764899|nr:uncharacterized protein LOC126795517 [Potentilla anserina]
MEGLIKGLLDVALGHGGDKGEDSVVSGEPENDSDRPHGYNNQNHWNRQEESTHFDSPRRPHKVQKDQWQGFKCPASEQQYSDEVEVGANLNPSEDELADLSQACNKIWELDLNRLVPGKDYEIYCGEGKKVYHKGDLAEGNLFSWLSEDVLTSPTYARFCSLLDNYNPNEGCKEVITSEEKQEQAAFIEEISRTAPIKYLHRYLSRKGIVSENYQEFKRTLTALWFNLYGRGGTSGCSSAFEHVFVGEIKQRGEKRFLASTIGFRLCYRTDTLPIVLVYQYIIMSR